MMTINNNNNNDWSVPTSRMDRLKAKEQQKEEKKQKKRAPKPPRGPQPNKPKKFKNKSGKSKKWLWIVGILIVLIGAIVFFVRRSSGNQAQANAEKIVQQSFNSDRDNITDTATRAQMVELAADAKQVRNNTEANQYSQLASLGKSAVAFRQRVENLKSGNTYKTSTTGTKVSNLLQDLKSSSFESDFSGFYSEYNKKLSALETKAKAVSKLHKQTNNLFKNGKSGSLAASVTNTKLNNLLDKLNKYPNFELANKDLTRVEKAVKTYKKKQASAAASIASSAAAVSSSSYSSYSYSSYSSSYPESSSSYSSYSSSSNGNSSSYNSSSKASSTNSSASSHSSSTTSASKSSSASSKTSSSSNR